MGMFKRRKEVVNDAIIITKNKRTILENIWLC